MSPTEPLAPHDIYGYLRTSSRPFSRRIIAMLDALVLDSDRLDSISQGWNILRVRTMAGGVWHIEDAATGNTLAEDKDLRVAIDAARKEGWNGCPAVPDRSVVVGFHAGVDTKGEAQVSDHYGKSGYDHKREQLERIEKREEAMPEEVKALNTMRPTGRAAMDALYDDLVKVNHTHTAGGIVYASAIFDWLVEIDVLTYERDALKHEVNLATGHAKAMCKQRDAAVAQRTRECMRLVAWSMDREAIRRAFPDAFAGEEENDATV